MVKLMVKLSDNIIEFLHNNGHNVDKEIGDSLAKIVDDFYAKKIYEFELLIEDIQSEECPVCYRVKGKDTSECDYCSWNVRRR